MAKTTLMENIELRYQMPIDELIRREAADGRSMQEIATMMGISYHTLRQWLPQFGLRTRRVIVAE